MAAVSYLPGVAIAGSTDFGIPPELLGPGFKAHQLFSSDRARACEWTERYYRCSQHDHKIWDFQGRMRAPVAHVSQPLIGGAVPNFYVPMDQRRPSAPYRLARTIVQRFTGMVFGQGRWPTIISTDPDTQDFATALVDALSLHDKMIRARNKGGATGAVGLSWWFDQGKPRVRVHGARNIHVLEWEDEDELIPAHVVELIQFARMEFVPGASKPKRVWYWQRRDWTPKADVVFKEQPVGSANQNPTVWLVDEEKSSLHGDGFTHFVWIENLPSNADITIADGVPDYEGTYEKLDVLDILNSVHNKGTTANLDPTLVLNMYPDEVGDAAVRKGSDNALAVGPTGTANYMTLGGDVVDAGLRAIKGQRDQVLEECECIIADPDQVAAAGTSSLTIRLVYAPMLNKCDLLRTAYGQRGIQRLLEQMLAHVRGVMPDLTQEDPLLRYVHEVKVNDDGSPVLNPETGEPELEPVAFEVKLPPRVEEEQVTDPVTGEPTGEVRLREIERHPGRGSIRLEWPPYFPKTAADEQQEAAALTAANGGKPVLSQQSSVERYALASNRDAQEEMARIQAEAEQEAEKAAAAQAGMFRPYGGG